MSIRTTTLLRYGNLALVMLLIIVSVSCVKQPEITDKLALQRADPESVGLDGQNLGQIGLHIRNYVDSGYIAGAVVMVSRDNKVVYDEVFGFADRAKTDSLRRDDIFRLASMTKPIIGVAVMQLYEQGKLDVNDPVSKYIPAFANPKVIEKFEAKDSSYTTRPAKSEVTIHHLLTHTSGISYQMFDPVAGAVYAPFKVTDAWTTDSLTLEMNIPKMGQFPLLHDPGTKWTYGTNMDILGYIIEVVSKQPLDKYLAENIFKPVGMNDTYFYLPEEKAERLVQVWYRTDSLKEMAQRFTTENYPVSGHKMYFAGGAGLSATAGDYMKFATMLLNKGTYNGVQVLKPETAEKMMSNQIGNLALEPNVQFGYTGSVVMGDHKYGQKKGRFSWSGFWQTSFWVDPARNIAVVIMTNAFDSPRSEAIYGGVETIVNTAVKK